MSDLKIGEAVPDFSATATSGTTFSLSDYRGRCVLIYFYPKDNTPGCTTESQDFRDHAPAFATANTVIVGVSRDSLRSHENFRKKQELPFELISDPQEHVCRLFGVIKLKKLYGKEYLGIERSTFLIDENGVLAREWRGVKVKGHVEDVLGAYESLNRAASFGAPS